jgi:spermidine synthase
MVGLSGFACLVYQVLWMRQVAVLFGNTTHAAALTLSVFFGGLSLGGWLAGARCPTLPNPFRTYARLEVGIAVAGIAILLGPFIVPRLCPLLADADGGGFMLAFLEVAWTVVMILPAALCMGATLPVAGEAIIRERHDFGRMAARLYAVNTLGAAAGALASAFLLIAFVGLRATCVVAMAASLTSAALALVRSRSAATGPRGDVPIRDAAKRKAGRAAAASVPLPRPLIAGLAFLSGFNLLALEVVWTRMLAHVHENSVYSFATVLIVVLACLALAAWLASGLARAGAEPPQVLQMLVVIGGIVLGFSPLLFIGLTGGARMLATDFSFATYVLRLFATTALAIGPACLALGTVFPFLMKSEEAFVTSAGASIGRLAAINTAGAILGSLAAGYWLLEWVGVWGSVQFVATAYLLLAFFLPAAGTAGVVGRVAAGAMLLLVFTALSPNRLPVPVHLDRMGGRETVLETLEGADCTVTVVRDSRNDLGITINSNYSLGSTAAYGSQIYQARIPLLAFPATESVFFLGMGTGITAGEALSRDTFPHVRRVVACELSANVVAASRKYFSGGDGETDPVNGLYRDPRARVIVGDGRTRLLAGRDRYSMINADLFLPYRRGTGNLYSREHFAIARDRLEPGGVFVQWLPLYQMTEREFGVIARTMLAVFPQVTLWRGNFQPGAEIAAIVGHADATPLPACSRDVTDEMRKAVEGATHRDMHDLMLPIDEQTVPLFYAGNLTRAADLFAHHPLNTDDMPVIEFGTPRSLHRPAGAPRPQFLESRFADLVARLQARTPPEDDPFLARRTAANRRLPLAGSAFHRAWIAGVHGDDGLQAAEWATFHRLWTE